MGVTATERLYYTDSYLTEFDGSIVDRSADGLRVYLDRTAFYPTSGGQPNDTGLLNGIAVVDVVDEDDRIAHVLSAPLLEGDQAHGVIDTSRRYDYRQQHSGQHLLSAVFEALFGFKTVSVHFGDESATVDLATASIAPEQLRAAELRANEVVFEDRPLTVAFEHKDQAEGLRKESKREGELRIVTIEGLDRSACGGTHVRKTGEIGPVLLRKLDKIRGNVRIEFICGLRAVRRARADFEALSQSIKALSCPIDELPQQVASLAEQLKESEKSRKRMAAELATRAGQELFQSTQPNDAGLRIAVEARSQGAFDDEYRARVQGFLGAGKGLFLATLDTPPSLLFGASGDSDVHAGNVLKPLLAQYGGRGGGNAQLAQGSLTSVESLRQLRDDLLQRYNGATDSTANPAT